MARMKARIEHYRDSDGDDYVCAGQREGSPLSNMALLTTLRRMKRDDITAHGFRSTFSDWASEVNSFAGELGETALAHMIQNKAERADRRGDALEKRRQMMEARANWPERDIGPSAPADPTRSIGAETIDERR